MRELLRGGRWLWALLLFAPGVGRADMEINGAIATENYLSLKEGEFYDFRNANLFRLKVKAKPSDQVTAFGDIELRNTNFTQIEFIGDLWDRGTVDPVGWRINEAYVALYGFLLDSDALTLDLKAGKQNIAWGEADAFNPTNNFDPYNLENPLEFDQRLGNVALKATLTVADELFILEGVLAPRFLPAVLPVDLFLGDDPFDNPLMPSLNPDKLDLGGMDLVPPGNQAIRTFAPPWDLDNLMAGLRLKWSMLGFDWSVSYFHGRDTIPAPSNSFGEVKSSREDGCPRDGTSCVIVTGVNLEYPRIDVIGFDFRGGIGDVGVWGEVGLIFPRAITGSIRVEGLGEVAQLLIVEDDPFAKWTVGAEYTFKGGWFFNLQWVHGFFTEQTGHDLHDYLFLVLRKSFLNERLKIETSLGGELDATRGRRALGGLFHALLSYKPFDGAEVVLGYVMARGEDRVSIEMFEPLDQAYLKIRADF
jgi:hypothetical protein